MTGEQVRINFDAVDPFMMSPQDIYANANVTLLKKLKEDRRLERKRAEYMAADLGVYFSMWANTPGGGLLLCGVANNGEFQGWRHIGQEKLNACEKAGEFAPDARHYSKRIPFNHPDGSEDFLVLFYVEYNESKVVYTNKQEVWERRGDTKHQLTDLEIRGLLMEKGQLKFEQEECGLEYPEDFDTDAVKVWADAVKKIRPELAERPIIDVLVLRRLGKLKFGRFVPNYACALLFAKDPKSLMPGCWIRFLRFPGKQAGTGQNWGAEKDEWIEGTIPAMILGAERVLEHQLRKFQRFDERMKFNIIDEYPKEAWFEAIVNACVHRSYGNGHRNMNIEIRMFDDRVVIESPGGFPAYITPENIYDSMHHPRNPVIVDALYHLAFVRCANEGTKRMRQAMRDTDLPDPVFQQLKSGPLKVSVTLKNNVEQRKVWVNADASEVLGRAIALSLNEWEKQVVNWVAEKGRIDVSEAVRLTGVTWHTAKKRLAGLSQRGILIYVKTKKAGKKHDTKAHFVLVGTRTIG